jgi:hypothetical protein
MDPFTSKNCSVASCDRSGAYRISGTPLVPGKSVSASPSAHILTIIMHVERPINRSAVANTRDSSRLRLARRLRTPMRSQALSENDDDRFLHDGSTRGTSIPLDIRRNLQPLPQKIISAPARNRTPFVRTASLPAFVSLSVLKYTRRLAHFSNGVHFLHDGKSICKTSRVAAS